MGATYGRRILARTIVGLLCILFVAQTHHASRATSITFDETHYLGSALRSIRDGRLDPRIVAVGVAPLPIILAYLPALAREEGAERANLWIGEPGDAKKILGPRTLTSLIFGLPLIIVMFVTIARRSGLLAATLGAGLISASPTILAAGSLATTDLAFGVTVFLAVLAGASWYDEPTQNRFLLWGAAVGVAIAAKYSGIFLLPVTGLLLAWKEWQLTQAIQTQRPTFRAWFQLMRTVTVKYLALLSIAAGACWLCHLLQTSGPLKAVAFEDTAPYSPWFKLLGRGTFAQWVMKIAHDWIPKPSPVEGIFFQIQHSGWGHSAYLMGDFSDFGWWYFFPCAFAFKSTPVELCLAVLLLCIGICSAFKPLKTLRTADGLTLTASLSILVFAAMMMTSPLNLGHRYILPVYPLLIALGVIQLARFQEKRTRALAAVTAALLAAQFVSSRSVASDFLPYFNSFCGGPSRGRWLLVDSSLDWGQGLKLLKHFQDAHPEPLALKYFGTALPEDYGVRAVNVDERPLDPGEVRYFAISATFLQGDYTQKVDPFQPLRQLEPFARAGESILIYDLQQPGCREALASSLNSLPKTPDGFLRWRSWSDTGED
jgi:hypothetical protein